MPEPPANWNNFLEQTSLSDVGLRRSNNQDSLAVVMAGSEHDWRERGHLFMVADGMGAHAAGELASKLACHGIAHTYHKLIDRPPPEALRQAIVETNAHIHGRGQANAEFQGMGTTTSALVLLPEGAMVAHVGDSRVYRLRNGRLDQLTFDHSLVWEMMAAGQIPRDGVASFVPKNIITRSLGPHPEVQVDLEGPFPLSAGDTFLLCSDGLTGPVKDEELGVILGTMSPQEAAQTLVDLANLRGGPDNVTVIIARVLQSPTPDSGAASSSGHAEGRSALADVHPAIWVVMGVALLAALGMTIAGQVIPAIVCVLGAIVAGVVGMLRHSGKTRPEQLNLATGPLGKGPHTSRMCQPNSEAADNLGQILQKLQQAAQEEKWNVDWGQFKAFQDAAATAIRGKNYAQAIRQYGLAISFLMSEIRHQRGKKGLRDNSIVDL